MYYRFPALLSICFIAIFSVGAFAQSQHYAVLLSEPPLGERLGSRLELQSAQARTYRQRVEAQQQSFRKEMDARHVNVLASAEYLLNAVFVQIPPDREAELKSVPGVKAVVPLRRYHMSLNRAIPLVNGTAAWNSLGGITNAGFGMKIAILDTGIDQNHPAFQDSSLQMPPGFPICQGSDCAFTNNKVIVARSYVRQLAAGSDPNNPAADSRPDDYSPRDRTGHGTAVASAAASVTNSGPAATITGIAPKAYLGNYKVFGSPEVNDFADASSIVPALEDALTDGMDVANLSFGDVALSGPLDSGSACGNPSGVPCDLVAQAVENAVKAGMLVFCANGNEGDTGAQSANFPTSNTIDSPADAPDAVAVGVSTNSHVFDNIVRVPGGPSSLQQIPAVFTDGPLPSSPVTAPLVDVTQIGNDGFACTGLSAGSLSGNFVLIARGLCSFATKAANAQNAGAAGIIFYSNSQAFLVPPSGLFDSTIPSVLISNANGTALKSFIDSNPNQQVTLDPGLLEVDDTQDADQLAFFSSLGPSTGDTNIKPDLVAPGTQMYMATSSYDPNSDMYDPSGYTAADGSSFSTPLAAGAAALVKQKNPKFTPAQIKSALVNTANINIIDAFGTIGTVNETGGGKLDANAALSPVVTVAPATVSFGALTASSTLPQTRTLQLTNTGASTVTVNISVQPNPAFVDFRAGIKTDKTSLTLAAGATSPVVVTLSGRLPSPGDYEGDIVIQGGSVALHVPFLYMMGDQIPSDVVPLLGFDFDGTVGQNIPDGTLAFKLIDDFGLPIPGANVTWAVTSGGGTLKSADAKTNQYGIATAIPVLGPQPCFTLGCQEFTARVAGFVIPFDGTARPQPTIPDGGIVNAASFEPGKAVAPGSYISIFGTGLSDDVNQASSLPLPLALDFVNVSFDVPSAGLSLPGRLIYVSPGQVNAQVPWELQGQSSVQVKVTIDFSPGNVYTLPLAPYSPAFFESTDAATGTDFVAALDDNFAPVGSGNPAIRGHNIQLFANGLGPVNNGPATGEPASSGTLATTTTTPTVMIGGKPAIVGFSGLAPGFPGLYQINVTVPTDAGTGVQPIVVSIGGVTSKQSNIVVQ